MYYIYIYIPIVIFVTVCYCMSQPVVVSVFFSPMVFQPFSEPHGEHFPIQGANSTERMSPGHPKAAGAGSSGAAGRRVSCDIRPIH